MALTNIVGGTDGAVAASGFNCDVDAWSAEIAVRETSWRPFDSEWENSANVAIKMTGQFTGTVQKGESNTAPVPDSSGIDADSFKNVSMTLTASTGCTFTGTANITRVGMNRPAADRMTVNYAFTFTGQPGRTWDEGL